MYACMYVCMYVCMYALGHILAPKVDLCDSLVELPLYVCVYVCVYMSSTHTVTQICPCICIGTHMEKKGHLTLHASPMGMHATGVFKIIEGQFHAFQRGASSKLVLKTVESCLPSLNYFGNATGDVFQKLIFGICFSWV
jgi:hypothetical protein